MAGQQKNIRNEHYAKGITLYDRGLYEEAIVEFEQALETTPGEDSPEARLASFYMGEAYASLGLAHLRMSMYHRAEEELKFALMLHPEYADLHFHLGVVYYKQQRYDEAEKELQGALAINPRYARALMCFGLARLHKGDEKGLESIAEAVEIEAAYDDERYTRALSLYRGGDARQALRLIEEVAETDVDQIGYLLEKGLEFMKHEMYQEAMSSLLEAVSICPHYADIRNYLGICYLQQGMVDLAMGQFHKALEINPNFVAARANLARVYEENNDIAACAGELRRIVELDPDNVESLRRLAELDET